MPSVGPNELSGSSFSQSLSDQTTGSVSTPRKPTRIEQSIFHALQRQQLSDQAGEQPGLAEPVTTKLSERIATAAETAPSSFPNVPAEIVSESAATSNAPANLETPAKRMQDVLEAAKKTAASQGKDSALNAAYQKFTTAFNNLSPERQERFVTEMERVANNLSVGERDMLMDNIARLYASPRRLQNFLTAFSEPGRENLMKDLFSSDPSRGRYVAQSEQGLRVNYMSDLKLKDLDRFLNNVQQAFKDQPELRSSVLTSLKVENGAGRGFLDDRLQNLIKETASLPDDAQIAVLKRLPETLMAKPNSVDRYKELQSIIEDAKAGGLITSSSTAETAEPRQRSAGQIGLDGGRVRAGLIGAVIQGAAVAFQKLIGR